MGGLWEWLGYPAQTPLTPKSGRVYYDHATDAWLCGDSYKRMQMLDGARGLLLRCLPVNQQSDGAFSWGLPQSSLCCSTTGTEFEDAPLSARDPSSAPSTLHAQGGKYLDKAHPFMEVSERVVRYGTFNQPVTRKGLKVHIQYASIAQKGFHPTRTALEWKCQDACKVEERFLDRDDTLLVGMFDGHGAVGDGEYASSFALNELPAAIAAGFRKYGYLPNEVVVDAYQQTSNKMCKELPSDTGCTALTAVCCGPDMHIAHCGDVRAVLGKTLEGGGIEARPLTTDHKASCKLERKRIQDEHKDAEILTFGMKDGSVPVSDEFPCDELSSADPPRVWAKNKAFPGCSFTRSLGSAVAKRLGIVATPDITSYRLSPTDRYVVFCTDGVTEFVSNEEIIKLCHKNADPLDAAEELVQTAFSWFVDDAGWSDDITVVVMKLHWPSVTKRTAEGGMNLSPRTNSGKHLITLGKDEFYVDRDYVPEKVIGRGSTGTVCAAALGSGERVAIKKLSDAFENVTDARRLLREVKLLRRMRHENIITLLDIQPPEDPTNFREVMLVYELMDTNLARIIKSKQELRNDHVRYFVYQILRALKYLHSGGVLHRDLKPSNLLLTAQCDLKVCNFDLVRSMRERGSTTDYVTCRWYRAPELLLLCDECDGAVDLWSVGCILGELLGRKPMFPGKDSVHQLSLMMQTLGTPAPEDADFISSTKARNHIKALPPQPRAPFASLYPTSNPQAVDLLERLLVFNPKKRISLADALAHPYFKSLHDESKEPVAEAALDEDFDLNMRLDLDKLREELLAEIETHYKTYDPTPREGSDKAAPVVER